ncbi:glycosyltransferase family 4 protein [Patescibacteria group bacterium]|nr:glycosyltransferase family 4 protein [Patescibacteria group bacterium]
MIKIAFDVSPLQAGHQTRGVGFYIQNLLQQLKKDSRVKVVEFDNLSQVKRADLVHYPFFDFFKASLPLYKKYPTVLTIHDVTPLLFPQRYPAGVRGLINLLRQKLALTNIDMVITDSESSRSDIIKILGIKEDIVQSIYLAAGSDFQILRDAKFLKKIKTKYSLPDRFVVYTGNVNWNKNILNLAKGCLESDLDLVIIGKSFTQKYNLDHPELRSFARFIEEYADNPRIHLLGFVETTDLVGIINLANVGLLPSFYEGFGLPILEFQACGLPVVTANTASMPEIAGQAAMLVDPYQPLEITQAINDVMQNNDLRKELVELGLKNIQRFSWSQCADQTIQVYKKIINGNTSYPFFV